MIPPLIFSLAFEVEVEGGVSDLVAIRDELMVATKAGKILRYSWEGQEIRDYSLDLRRIPFCVDQQVGQGYFFTLLTNSRKKTPKFFGLRSKTQDQFFQKL